MTTGQTTTPGKLKPHLALSFANVLFGMNFSFYVSIIHHYMDFEDLFFFRVAFAAVCFYVLDKNVKDRAHKIQNSWQITHKNRQNHEKIIKKS